MAMKEKILIDRLSHCRYGHPDLEAARKFFTDFGLVPVQEAPEKIYFRGFGRDQFVYVAEKTHDGKRRFLGGGWAVRSLGDLEIAAKAPGATPVHDFKGPGGGKCVIMPDIMGEEVVLLYGQTDREVDPKEVPDRVQWNTWDEKRRAGVFQRPERESPSRVHKLGHYGFEVKLERLTEVVRWYCDTFNLKETDSLRNEENGKTVMTFIHIDKGKEYVDHHNIFIAGGPIGDGIKAHHTSFEVDDMDSQLVGHHYLLKQGWINVFGVGRHVLGSQIFDYWFDSSGFLVEHYVDGDLVNDEKVHEYEPATAKTVSSWGPDIPKAFFSKKLEDVVGLEVVPEVPVEA